MPKVFKSSNMIDIHEIINQENICTEYNTNVLILPSTQQIKIYQYLSLWHLVALDTGICSEKGTGPCSPADSYVPVIPCSHPIPLHTKLQKA